MTTGSPPPVAVGRFAPSPSGRLHLGHLQTLLLGWLQIRAAGGRFLLRIEDIDPSRTLAGGTDAILRDMEWLGFDWDEGPGVGGPAGSYLQSERLDLYRQACARLGDRVFPCTCSRKEVRRASVQHRPSGEWPYPGTCRQAPSHPGADEALRVRVEPQSLGWNDRWRGPCAQDPADVCGDFIVWTKAGWPTYQLAVVVDDIAMGITEVLRGEDLLVSTARQLLLYRWLGAPAPRFTHVPLRVDESGHKLAKSRGSAPLADLRAAGRDPRDVLGEIACDLGLLSQPTALAPGDLLEPFVACSVYARLRLS